ncbi:hypothetical protein [Actinoplanes sp. NPDC023714]|uniref:hypothetical protein n=1 Tax=Actinoplanes sp. NPDC023714 TaxID=3154322 RepID=UPI0033C7485E
MLFDDDPSGPPHQPPDEDDDRQLRAPKVDPRYLERFDGLDRILVVLEVGHRARHERLSYRADQVFENAGVPWDEPTYDEVVKRLESSDHATVRSFSNGMFFKITEYGADHVRRLTRRNLPGPLTDTTRPGPYTPPAPPSPSPGGYRR